jgi:probable phosphoglycerate mutase
MQLDHIVSSPLIRAVQTAEIVATVFGKAVAIDHDIIECDFGSLEGRSIRAAMDQHGITAMADLVSILPSDGEAWAAVSERALRCVSKWLDHHPRAGILFVCHDAVMQSVAQTLCGSFFNNHHGTPFRFTRTGDAWSVDGV